MNTSSVGSVTGSFFTRQNLGFVQDQKNFEALRAQNPAPLSEHAAKLVEARGLTDTLVTQQTGKVNVYA
ncbi:MAG: hypothetical protein WC774_03775 [Candidatus Gracilibacteria bacterium]